MKRAVKDLIEWYQKEGRKFPWRETENPYKILIAESMLQKTSASQVLPVYKELLEKYPSPERLGGADVDDIADIIYSLGLQNTRAKRLKDLGQELEEGYGGELPRDKESLKELPGVGEYISDSVLTLAFGEGRTMIDANVGRVLGRVYFGEKDYSLNSGRIIEKAEELLPGEKAREFNLAVIDLGALICRPKTPSCNDCPLTDYCEYFKEKRNDD